MLRRSVSLLVLAPFALALAGCESATDPSTLAAPSTVASRTAPFMATSEYVEMVATLRELYDRAIERGYSQDDIARAAAAGDAEADARLLGLTTENATRITGRLEALRGRLEGRFPQLAPSADRARSQAGPVGPGGIETVAGAGLNQTAAAGCRWLPAISNLFSCARNGTISIYVACAMYTWANYCDDITFTDFLEGVGSASDAFGGGGGGAY